MKLVEKLGKDAYYKWAEPFPPNVEIVTNPELMYRHAYRQGFRKAREIVAARVRMQVTCSRARKDPQEFMDWIEKTGEEEV